MWVYVCLCVLLCACPYGFVGDPPLPKPLFLRQLRNLKPLLPCHAWAFELLRFLCLHSRVPCGITIRTKWGKSIIGKKIEKGGGGGWGKEGVGGGENNR